MTLGHKRVVLESVYLLTAPTRGRYYSRQRLHVHAAFHLTDEVFFENPHYVHIVFPHAGDKHLARLTEAGAYRVHQHTTDRVTIHSLTNKLHTLDEVNFL